MFGVENRFLEATDEPGPLTRGGTLDERSLILEEKLHEIAATLFEDPLLAFRAVKACAERQILEIESTRAKGSAASEPEPFGLDSGVSAPEAAYSVDGSVEDYFSIERATFEAIKDGLEPYEGRYVVIKGDEVAGIWPSYEEALDGGYDRFGPVTFFVKQLGKSETTRRVSRDRP